MNIIIPLGGRGERFSKTGKYSVPKALIPIFGKPMIVHVLDHLKITENDRIFIIYNKGLDDYGFSQIISNINSNRQPIVTIPVGPTKGAVETLAIGIKQILASHQSQEKTILLDCDTFYTQDILAMFRQIKTNAIFYTKNTDPNPIYSYITIDADYVTQIKEKEKISDNANTGAYAFASLCELYDYCNRVLETGITFRGEPYTSCVIHEMLCNNHQFAAVELNLMQVFSLGTPADVDAYIDRTKAYLFDLDGTLVLSDTIYYNVWTQLLKQYNINLTRDMYDSVIQGNTDKHVVKHLLQNTDVSIISKQKDDLFISMSTHPIVIDGAIQFIENIKQQGHMICIVTNSNNRVAKSILQSSGLIKYVDFLITSDDCIHGKPNPEPYALALKKLGLENANKCIIYEDSKSGILSAKCIAPAELVGLTTQYDKNTLLELGVHRTINNFLYEIEQDIVKMNVNSQFSSVIQDLYDNFGTITIDPVKLKGGFIADVVSFTYNGCSYIFKYETQETTGLSTMAKQLDLYNREYDFYTHISKDVPIKVPQHIKCLNYNSDSKNKKSHNRGIVLENLKARGMTINLDLNIHTNVAFTIIEKMAQLHAKFWNTEFHPVLKNTMDPIFYPFLPTFVEERRDAFLAAWPSNTNVFESMFQRFSIIQRRFSEPGNLTFIHGDIKSPNIFYEGTLKDTVSGMEPFTISGMEPFTISGMEPFTISGMEPFTVSGMEPWFIDWQHCGIGKGVQDLIFFLIESFQPSVVTQIFNDAIRHYYNCLKKFGVNTYEWNIYICDLRDAVGYIPFFTAVWFGTLPVDELIDKDFPDEFIGKLLNVHNLCNKISAR